MKQSHLKKVGYAFFCTVMILGALLLIGCGDDGDTGPAGPAGPAGPPGPRTTTAESCAVCHTADKIADIALEHPDPTDEPLTVTVTAVTDIGAGILRVGFTLSDTAGVGVEGIGLDSNRFYISDIVPAGTATASWGTWDTDYLERWAYEMDSTGYPLGTWAEIGGGDYTYTFATALGSAEALSEAPDYNAADVQRLVFRVDGRDYGYTRAVGIQDFMVDDTLLAPQRVLAPIEGCKKCHSPEMDNAAHASSYLDTRACAMCHSPLGHYGTEMQDDAAWLTSLIHKIHSAIPMAAFPDRIDDLGYGAVTYPQDVRVCETCHTGSDNMTNAWKTHPTAEACGSCHVTVNFATGENHGGGVQTSNAGCVYCHPASGTGFGMSITTAHDTTPTGVNVPEFDVTLTITDPVNGSYYGTSEEPKVTVTLKDHATGLPVDPAVYTTPQDAAGVTGGGLRVAGLYMYGPRAKSVPVLATGTITDPAFDAETDTPTQGHDLFTGGADPQVTTNSSGFGYQLLPIPADVKAGTYMVRVRIGDYGRVGTGNYHIESIAFTTIQIGTATLEDKVAGDACINCHGTGTAPFHDERHVVVFDTDQCLACHDQSGNFAIPIANRVHAVHSANSAGDLYNIEGGTSRDWSDVTYPQGTLRCVGCHTSDEDTYKTLPYMMPCAGCHVGATGVLDHMRQNGGPF